MNNKGQRRFERADFQVKGFLKMGETEFPFQVVNISLKGILITMDSARPEKGSIYPLRVALPHSDVNIATESLLLHAEDGKYGFKFTSIDAEGMIHLRRLLELNISTEDEIEKELEFLSDA